MKYPRSTLITDYGTEYISFVSDVPITNPFKSYHIEQGGLSFKVCIRWLWYSCLFETFEVENLKFKNCTLQVLRLKIHWGMGVFTPGEGITILFMAIH